MTHIANMVFAFGFLVGSLITGFISYKVGVRTGKSATKDNK